VKDAKRLGTMVKWDRIDRCCGDDMQLGSRGGTQNGRIYRLGYRIGRWTRGPAWGRSARFREDEETLD
jgi:hypothetical protein